MVTIILNNSYQDCVSVSDNYLDYWLVRMKVTESENYCLRVTETEIYRDENKDYKRDCE